MVKVNGFMNSRWSGRMGNTIFRTVRGQIIASEEPQKTDAVLAATRMPTSVARQNVFGLISRYASMHSADIKASFDKTKLGSARNYFMQLNYSALEVAFASLTLDASDSEIEKAVKDYAEKNPFSIVRVRRTGYPRVYLSGEWSSDDNPVEIITVTPARVTSVVIGSESYSSSSTLSAAALTSGQTIRINGSNLDGAGIKLYIGGTEGTSNQEALSAAKNVADVIDITSQTSAQIAGTLKTAATSAVHLLVAQNSNILFHIDTIVGGGEDPLG